MDVVPAPEEHGAAIADTKTASGAAQAAEPAIAIQAGPARQEHAAAVAEPVPAGRASALATDPVSGPGTRPQRPRTAASGLTDAEVAARTADGLANGDRRHSSRPVLDIVRANVLTPFNALLGTLAALVMVTGAIGDALFGLLLVVNSAIGIIQELRAKRTLDRLAVLSDPRARVVRNGAVSEIPVDDVVLDDLVELRPGDQVPADCCVRQVDGLEIDESLVTGESDPVAKQPGDVVLSGSNVVAGSGTAQVTAVGADSFANRLTDEAREFSLVRSELTEGINRILKYVAISLAVVGPILFISQSSTTSTWQEAVRGAVAGLVGMVPEGLVLLTSVTFFAAALSLARKRVLVRELPAVEGLARIDMLCLDKTGTLTEGQIAFTGVEPFGPDLCEVDEALAALAADRAGNATVVALRQVFPEPPGWEKVAAVPFSSARKWSATSFDGHGTWVLGAPEILMAGAPDDNHVKQRVEALAAAGTRTLLLARSNAPLPPSLGDHNEHAIELTLPPDLVAVSLVTFQECVRSDAADTLRYFTAQGVSLKIISGDNPVTVGAIARRVQLPGTAEPMDARHLPTDPAELAAMLDERAVFGRVTPQQKRSIVHGLQSLGHVVAMTGDGVNDTLALKDADIGVAMGSGTPATRAVAQLVLLDSEFSVLPGVVAEGRRVIANVERVANLFLTKNVMSLVLALAVAVAGWPFPFLPRHLTLVSTVVIGLPGFLLALGPSTQRFTPGFVPRVLKFAIPSGVIAAIAVFITYGLARDANNTPAQSKTAATIVLFLVSLWVLAIQARPMRPWKMALVAAMGGLGALAFALPVGRQFYDLRLPSALIAAAACALAAGAAIALEVLCHWTLPARDENPVPG
ncbi:MAG: cation-transporting P-type ATPase [Acidimicrobiaceae bacterium]|nr:cation-transporting P-type ATPase [Acidimicrobiaceae bacterium]